jgi:hypothetical protein
MSTLRAPVAERQPLKSFRLRDVPEPIRNRAVERAYRQARAEGLAGVALLTYVLEAKLAAKHADESERLHYVSQEAWRLEVEETRIDAKRYLNPDLA